MFHLANVDFSILTKSLWWWYDTTVPNKGASYNEFPFYLDVIDTRSATVLTEIFV